jgi:esterase/lipase
MPKLDVPIILAQGRLDQVVPGVAAQKFYDALTAPSKQLIWFEHSAHTPQYDEPAKFRDVLLTLRAGDLAAT